MASRVGKLRVRPRRARAREEPRLSPWAYLLLLTPFALAAGAAGAPLAAFPLAVLSLIGGAFLLGQAAEVVAAKLGDGVGSLVTATLSNAVTLAILGAALLGGLEDVVKASVTGSILGDLLVAVGGSMLLGGLRREKQVFGKEAAALSTTMLLVASFALVTPGLAGTLLGAKAPGIADKMTAPLAVLLLATYVAGLLFATRTHKHLFNPETAGGPVEAVPRLVAKHPLPLLAGTIVLVGLVAETLAGSLEPVGEQVGLHPLFLSVVVIGVVTNAVEIATAWKMARKDRMNVSLQVAVSSSLQVMLFVVPLLVLASQVLPNPLTLDFPLTMTVAIGMAAVLVNVVSSDGESTWYEGAMLLALYGILAMVFYFE